MKYTSYINALASMKKYPQTLYVEGNTTLLNQKKVSIVGSRNPTSYTRSMTNTLANELAQRGVVVVSGAAMGVDAIAHKAAKVHNTIAVLPCGINQRYPKINKQLIDDIADDGLLISQFEEDFRATPYSFVVRNELVVSLGDVLVVTQADLDSGSMRSVEFALAMNKKVYVLAQRIGESEGTNKLLAEGRAELIVDIEKFCDAFGSKNVKSSTPLLEYCKKNPNYDDVLAHFEHELLEAELEGIVRIENAQVVIN